MDIVKQTYELHGNVILQQIQLQDFMTTDVKFKNLIYSHPEAQQGSIEKGEALITGSFLKSDGV